MATKTYACHQWPEMRLGRVAFAAGWCSTDDPSEQDTIEHHEHFGRFIHAVNETEIPPEKPSVPAPEEEEILGGRAYLGARGTGRRGRRG